jgi:hypothetical protein
MKMKIPYVIALLAATSTPAIAAPADSLTPRGSEIQSRDDGTAPSNGQPDQGYGTPEECPEGTRFDIIIPTSTCYQVCVDINDPTKTQVVQRKKGSKCGQLLFWTQECSAEGHCALA